MKEVILSQKLEKEGLLSGKPVCQQAGNAADSVELRAPLGFKCLRYITRESFTF